MMRSGFRGIYAACAVEVRDLCRLTPFLDAWPRVRSWPNPEQPFRGARVRSLR